MAKHKNLDTNLICDLYNNWWTVPQIAEGNKVLNGSIWYHIRKGRKDPVLLAKYPNIALGARKVGRKPKK